MRTHLLLIALFLVGLGPIVLAGEKPDLAAAEKEAAAASKDFLKVDADLKVAIAAVGDDPEDADAAKALKKIQAAQEEALDRLEKATDALADAGGNVTEYNALLFAHGRARADVAAALGFVAQVGVDAKDWIADNGTKLLFNIAVFVLIILVFRFLGRVAAGLVRRMFERTKIAASNQLKEMAIKVSRTVVRFIGITIALEYAGVPIGPLLAGAGVLGLVVAFALQDTLGNFASGVMILINRPYDTGDYITAGGVSGTVTSMTLVSTRLLTPDNRVILCPNNSIWGSTIKNHTAMPTRRMDLVVGVGYGDDLNKTQDVLLEVAKAHEMVLADPAPEVAVSNLGDSSVDFTVRVWVDTSNAVPFPMAIMKTIKQRLDTEGIEIPFPQRDVHMHQAD
jgi:small conductance mechanosensitive channel